MRPALIGCLALGPGACAPVVLPGPRHLNLQALPAQEAWTVASLLERGEVPRTLLRPLPEALALAPLGSVIVACQQPSAASGLCTHVTRKVGPALLSEESGARGTGARYRPLDSLLDRDVVFVLDVGVREGQLAALLAQTERLRGAPWVCPATRSSGWGFGGCTRCAAWVAERRPGRRPDRRGFTSPAAARLHGASGRSWPDHGRYG